MSENDRNRRLELIDDLLTDDDPARVARLRSECLRQLRRRQRLRLQRHAVVVLVVVLGLGTWVSRQWGETPGDPTPPPRREAPPTRTAPPPYVATTASLPPATFVHTRASDPSMQVTTDRRALVVRTNRGAGERVGDEELLACFPDQPVALFRRPGGAKELRFLGP